MKSKPRQPLDLGVFTSVSFWSSLGLSLLVMLVYVLSRPEIHRLPALNILEVIEAKTLDARFLLRGSRTPPDDIVIVAVDEKTEDALGRWQSSGRQWIAKLLDILRDGHARVVGLDLVLAEPDESRGLQIIEELATLCQDNSATPPTRCAPEIQAYIDQAPRNYDYDRQLAEAIQRFGAVVLGLYHYWDVSRVEHFPAEKQQASQNLLTRVAYKFIQFPAGVAPQPLLLPHSYGVESNLPIFSDAAASFGHFDVFTDRDGFVRFTPLLAEYGGEYYPSFALEIARIVLNPTLTTIQAFARAEGNGGVNVIALGDRLIPCDETGRLLINYYGKRGRFTYYSLSDVLSGEVPAYKFGDKLVLLGFTSRVYLDLYSTPFTEGEFPGVEINATILANLLQGEFLTKPTVTTITEAALIVCAGLILGFVRHRKGPTWEALFTLFAVLCVIGIAWGAFLVWRIWINMTYPVLFIFVDYLTITSYKYFTEERQKRGLRNAFQHYVSPSVVTQMMQSIETLKLGGERRQLTAFFSDIRGFTGISEKMSPEQLVVFLNEYLSAMTDIVLKYEGTLDKYMGDAIMAFYGAPMDQADHAMRACKTAVDMLQRLKELRVDWEARGLPPMNIGIGINTGEMSVGNMGSHDRFDYTIMGDHVNLASRLEGVNKYYGTNIIISEFTYAACQACMDETWNVRELDTIRVKGKHEPVTIYELLGYGTFYEHKRPLAQKFSAGLQAYKQRQWLDALACFQEVLQLDPQDQPARLYITRCTEYRDHPPSDDWAGVYDMTSK